MSFTGPSSPAQVRCSPPRPLLPPPADKGDPPARNGPVIFLPFLRCPSTPILFHPAQALHPPPFTSSAQSRHRIYALAERTPVWRKKFEGRRLRRRRGACGGRVGHHRPAQHPGGVGRETLHAAVCFGDDVPYKMHMVTSPILPSSWLGRGVGRGAKAAFAGR
jgi:hypothetical protein